MSDDESLTEEELRILGQGSQVPSQQRVPRPQEDEIRDRAAQEIKALRSLNQRLREALLNLVGTEDARLHDCQGTGGSEQEVPCAECKAAWGALAQDAQKGDVDEEENCIACDKPISADEEIMWEGWTIETTPSWLARLDRLGHTILSNKSGGTYHSDVCWCRFGRVPPGMKPFGWDYPEVRP